MEGGKGAVRLAILIDATTLRKTNLDILSFKRRRKPRFKPEASTGACESQT